MATLPFAIDELNAGHLEGLVSAEAAEGTSLEFKSEPYGHDHEGVREFLKDITSLANTAGGFLLMGIREEMVIAKAISPISSPDPDKMKQRLESLLQTAVEPRIFGVRIQPVPMPGGYVLAIRVPRSATPPHRVTAKNSNRFYLRSSAGAYEASMDELRNLFSQAGAASERVAKFHSERLNSLPTDLGVQLAGDDRFVLHIIPLNSVGIAPSIPLAAAHQKIDAFRPMGDYFGYSPRFNAAGFINIGAGSPSRAYTQVFRDGVVEAVQGKFLSNFAGHTCIHALTVGKRLTEVVPSYVGALRSLDVNPPLFVLVAFTGVGNAFVACTEHPGPFFEPPPGLSRSTLSLPICVFEDYGDNAFYSARLKPALDALWNAGGRSEWPG